MQLRLSRSAGGGGESDLGGVRVSAPCVWVLGQGSSGRVCVGAGAGVVLAQAEYVGSHSKGCKWVTG